MKTILLSKGKGKAIVDDEDYEYLSQFKWYLSSHGYPMRVNYAVGSRVGIGMHRDILKPTGNDKLTEHELWSFVKSLSL